MKSRTATHLPLKTQRLDTLCDAAGVPLNEREVYVRSIRQLAALLWRLIPRRSAPKSVSEIKKAAQKAAELDKAVSRLSVAERAIVDRVVRNHPWLRDESALRGKSSLLEPDELLRVVWLLALTLNTAAGRPYKSFSGAPLPRVKRRGFRDLAYQHTVRTLLLLADEAKAPAHTFDKNTGTGRLSKVLTLLRPHLPPGVIPDPLPNKTTAEIRKEYLRDRAQSR